MHLTAASTSHTPNQSILRMVVLLCSSLWATTQVAAQIDILSTDDPATKWREAQLAALETQLEDSGLAAQLRKELEAQRVWLGHWQPHTLTTQPLWQ